MTDKADWLIVEGSDYEQYNLDDAVLALGKTLEEVLPIGLLGFTAVINSDLAQNIAAARAYYREIVEVIQNGE